MKKLALALALGLTLAAGAATAAMDGMKEGMKEGMMKDMNTMQPGMDNAAMMMEEGKALYLAKCAGCHGADGAKGLKGKTAEAVTKALTGYRAKTYGGAKKDIMEARAANLSDQDIKALAGFVEKL